MISLPKVSVAWTAGVYLNSLSQELFKDVITKLTPNSAANLNSVAGVTLPLS